MIVRRMTLASQPLGCSWLVRLPASSVTFGAATSACEKAGHWQKILEHDHEHSHVEASVIAAVRENVNFAPELRTQKSTLRFRADPFGNFDLSSPCATRYPLPTFIK